MKSIHAGALLSKYFYVALGWWVRRMNVSHKWDRHWQTLLEHRELLWKSRFRFVVVLFDAAVSTVVFAAGAAAVVAAAAPVVYAAAERPASAAAVVAVALFVEIVIVHFALLDSLTYILSAIMSAVILNIYIYLFIVLVWCPPPVLDAPPSKTENWRFLWSFSTFGCPILWWEKKGHEFVKVCPYVNYKLVPSCTASHLQSACCTLSIGYSIHVCYLCTLVPAVCELLSHANRAKKCMKRPKRRSYHFQLSTPFRVALFIVNWVGMGLRNLKLKPQNGASDYKHEYRGGQGWHLPS